MEIDKLIEILEGLEEHSDGKVYVDGKEIKSITITLSNELTKETSINISTI